MASGGASNGAGAVADVLRDVEAISFDLFDTLVDQDMGRLPFVDWEGRRVPSTALSLHALVAAARPVPADDFLRVMREVDRDLREPRFAQGRELPTLERFQEVVARLGIADEALAHAMTDEHMRWIRSCTTAPAHHAPLLARLAARRALALCSNFSHTGTAVRVVEEMGVRPHLRVVVVSEAVDARKPFPAIFEAVLAGLGVAPERVLHVGDSLRADVVGAARAGMRTAWITRRVKDRAAALAAHEGPPPDVEIADLAELESLLADSAADAAAADA